MHSRRSLKVALPCTAMSFIFLGLLSDATSGWWRTLTWTSEHYFVRNVLLSRFSLLFCFLVLSSVFLHDYYAWVTCGFPVFCHQCSLALFVISKAWNLSNFNMAALRHGSRKFYEIPSSEEFTHLRSNDTLKKEKNVKELFKYIEESCIGEDVTFCGPYGPRKGKFGWPLMYFYW